MSGSVKQIVVLSGKGGTGKTTITSSFAYLAGDMVVADCDVDAPNLSLVLQGKVRSAHPFSGSLKAVIDPASCTQCGLCEQKCQFSAIKDFHVDSPSCEGCGVCHLVCQAGAVRLFDALSGHIRVNDTPYGTVIDAEMFPGEPNSGKLAAKVRSMAMEEARQRGIGTVLIDGPPGTGCPVISSTTGADLVVIVSEPTPSGKHDLQRVIRLAGHFRIPCAVIINKYDLDEGFSKEVSSECISGRIPVIGMVPYDESVGEAVAKGLPLPLSAPRSAASIEIASVWEKVKRLLNEAAPRERLVKLE